LGASDGIRVVVVDVVGVRVGMRVVAITVGVRVGKREELVGINVAEVCVGTREGARVGALVGARVVGVAGV
jgi:hypothetical protein